MSLSSSSTLSERIRLHSQVNSAKKLLQMVSQKMQIEKEITEETLKYLSLFDTVETKPNKNEDKTDVNSLLDLGWSGLLPPPPKGYTQLSDSKLTEVEEEVRSEPQTQEKGKPSVKKVDSVVQSTDSGRPDENSDNDDDENRDNEDSDSSYHPSEEESESDSDESSISNSHSSSEGYLSSSPRGLEGYY